MELERLFSSFDSGDDSDHNTAGLVELPKAYLKNVLISYEIADLMHIYWDSRFTFLYIFQQPLKIESCFNFSDALHPWS